MFGGGPKKFIIITYFKSFDLMLEKAQHAYLFNFKINIF